MNATRYLDRVWLVSSIIGITVGAGLWISGAHDGANVAWAITTVIGGIPLVVDVVRSIARREPSVDFIALLAIIVSLWLDEYLAGAVIALMLSTGQALESYADRHAQLSISGRISKQSRLG